MPGLRALWFWRWLILYVAVGYGVSVFLGFKVYDFLLHHITIVVAK